MNLRLWWVVSILPLVVVVSALAGAAQADGASTTPRAGSFASDSSRAMDRMMAAMPVEPTGDADRDFVAAMVPHHQSAVDMALAELRYGKDETLRRMAQEIIVEQKQEIDAMQLAADRLLGARSAGPALADICKGRSMSQSMHDTLVPEGH